MYIVNSFQGIQLHKMKFDCVESAFLYADRLDDDFISVTYNGNVLELGNEYVCGICLSYGEACNDATLNELELD